MNYNYGSSFHQLPIPTLNMWPFWNYVLTASPAERTFFTENPEQAYRLYLEMLYPSVSQRDALSRQFQEVYARYLRDLFREPFQPRNQSFLDWLTDLNPDRLAGRLPRRERGVYNLVNPAPRWVAF